MTLGKSASYRGWDTESHLHTFDGWNGQSNSQFNFVYGCFAEQQYLGRAIQALTKPSILDVGCATGTTYRYLRNTQPEASFSYQGVDLSAPAISRARSLYPGVSFSQKGQESLRNFVGRSYDIVYSRDTTLHQTEPFKFLTDLLDVTDRFLVLRLRTRDHGATEWDFEASCQMHYDQYWMPYIVINTNELIDFLASFKRLSRVTLNRSYEVLGGQNYRYLPKDLYFTNAGAAETSVLIEVGSADRSGELGVAFDDTVQGHAYVRRHRMKYYGLAAFSRLLRAMKSR